MALKGAAKRAIQQGVDTRTDFTIGNVRGVGPARFATTGELPTALAQALSESVRQGEVTYIVYSYATPIAWYNVKLGWITPPIKYSVTTTNHQNVTRTAIEYPGFYADARW